jgi:hypothetical protein
MSLSQTLSPMDGLEHCLGRRDGMALRPLIWLLQVSHDKAVFRVFVSNLGMLHISRAASIFSILAVPFRRLRDRS